MILITGVITLVVKFWGSIVVNISFLHLRAVLGLELWRLKFLFVPLSCRRVAFVTKKIYFFVVPFLSLFLLVFIVMFISCKNGKYSVWFEVKCSLDYYVYILDSLESVNIFATTVRRKCVSVVFFVVKGLLIFLPPVVQTFDHGTFFQKNHYSADKYSGKKSPYALERSLYNG